MCLELLDAWRARRDSDLLPDLLVKTATLSPEELELRRRRHEAEVESALRMPQRMMAAFRNHPGRAQMMRLVERQAAERLEREQRAWAITLTEVLPPGLRRALALSVLVGIERQWDDDGFRRAHARRVEPVLSALALPPFEQSARGWRKRRWLRTTHGEVEARTGVLPPGERASCVLWADRAVLHASVSLPISWFTEVWAHGITLVDGFFVLDVEERSPDGTAMRVLAARPARRRWRAAPSLESPALITRRRGGWRLRWL